MPDAATIRENVKNLVAAGAPDEDIDAYMASVTGRSSPSERTAEDISPSLARMGEAIADRANEAGGVEKAIVENVGRRSGLNAPLGRMQALNQGASLAFADEAAAGIDAALGYDPEKGYLSYPGLGKSYDASLSRQRRNLAEYREDSPLEAMALETVGTAPYAAGIGAAAVAPRAASSVAGNIARGGAGAALPATAYGYGAGEGGPEKRGESAVQAGALGLGLGAAIPAAVHGASGLARGVRNAAQARTGGQASVAGRKQAEGIIGDFPDTQTPEAAFAAAQRRLQELGPEAVSADVGPRSRSLAGAVYREGGQPATLIERTVIPRQEGARGPDQVLRGGQYGRVSRALDDVTPERATGTRQQLFQERSAAGREAYEQALDVGPIHSDRIAQFVDDPIARGGLRRGLETQRLEALAEGRPFDPHDYAITGFNEAGDPIIGAVPNMRTYDAIKRGLDAIIAEEITPLGRMTERGRAVNMVRREFVRELDARNPAYAQARQSWAGPSRLLDATNEGFRFLSKAEFANADEMAARVADMSQPERHHFRIGAAQALRDKAGEVVRRGDISKQLAGKPELERKIRLAFGSRDRFARYIRALENEGEMFKLYAEITGQSATQQRQAAARALQDDPGGAAGPVMDAMAQAPTRPISAVLGLIPRGLGAARRWAGRMPEGARTELAQGLMGRDIAALYRQAAAMRGGQDARRRAMQYGLGSVVGTQPMRRQEEMERPY